jgi:aminopeptidase N
MSSTDAVHRLADYRPPAWCVRRVELAFDLDADATLVESRLELEPDPAQPLQPLRLEGEDLELLSIELDGRVLAADAYRQEGGTLAIEGLDAACVLRTVVRIHPRRNTRLEGLYASGPMLLTQCEAEGFRRITYFVDRPDAMATWRVTLRAPREAFPVLLANGNPVGAGELADGRHWVTWDDPHPKPCYLFALVAGRLDCLSRELVTMEGRRVHLAVWAEERDLPRCVFALDAVERALRWDEARFGRAYDLDQFNVVAAQDFTMGAMENKGLNIFNARYILADADTATDADFMAVESVIGHEYFHNWSGNRVTLRDWFQLSLKEGLTVFRDQEFSADLHSRSVKRIEDVRLLRSRQFAEDAGPLAHPVRPPEYREINNFYTATVYEKGAEIVRMLHTLLGEESFRAGMDRYFAANDGRAATVEDFLAAMAQASGRDLGQFARWYAQAGTPEVGVAQDFDAAKGRLSLRLSQRIPGQADAAPLHIPLRLALFDAQGAALPLAAAGVRDGVLELREAEATLVIDGLREEPVISLNQGFGAPIRLRQALGVAQLATLARCEPDGFNRWEAMQRLALLALIARDAAARDALCDALRAGLQSGADPALLADCLELPDFDTLAGEVGFIDADALVAAREELLDFLAEALADALDARYASLAEPARGGLVAAAIAARRLRNAILPLLSRLDPQARLAQAQFDAARVMSDRLAALRCLLHFDAPGAGPALDRFQQRFAGDALVEDKWIGLLATRPHPDALDAVRDLLASPHWKPANPNRVRALLGNLARNNPLAFHRLDGAGYGLLAEQIAALDALNPQVAGRLLTAFENWARLAGERRGLARAALASLDSRLASADGRDLLQRLLAQA